MNIEDFYTIYDNENHLKIDKDSVGIFCHQASSGMLRPVTEDIFRVYDCTVLCSKGLEENMSRDDLDSVISRMSLLVFIIDRPFLSEKNPARDIVLTEALRLGCRIMPVQTEAGVEALFNTQIGSYQLISRNAPEYMQQLKAFIEQVVNVYRIVGLTGEQEEIIKKPFRRRGFISYRKKNTAELFRLISEIRSHPSTADVALWYDRSLYPGKDYNEQIASELSSSDFVIFIVTPELFETGNYALEREYAQAISENKPIYPIIMKETEPQSISLYFEGADTVQFGDESSMQAVLNQIVGSSDLSHIDPFRRYALARAFEEGRGTELNLLYAYKLYSENAEFGEPFSMVRLAGLYKTGSCVPIDPAIENMWWNRAADALYEMLIDTPSDLQESHAIALSLFNALDECLVSILNSGSLRSSRSSFDRAVEILSKMQQASSRLQRIGIMPSQTSPAKLYLREGDIYLECGMPENAARSYNKACASAEELIQVLGENVYLSYILRKAQDGLARSMIWKIRDFRGRDCRGLFASRSGLLPEAELGDTYGQFSASGYVCPCCGKRLYKTVFPAGRDALIYIDTEPVSYFEAARVFMCPYGSFFAAPKGHRLTDGVFADIRFGADSGSGGPSETDQRLFDNMLIYYNGIGELGAKRSE